MPTRSLPQSMRDKDFILHEIRRTAALNGGRPVGARRFETESGIAEHEWRGSLWARWGDALSEAGFAPLEWTTGSTPEEILGVLAKLVRQYGKYPTVSEILIAKRNDQGVPTPKAMSRKLGSKAEAVAKLRRYCAAREEFADVSAILTNEPTDGIIVKDNNGSKIGPRKSKPTGYVYLVKSGKLYKIGYSENHWRRKSELHKQTSEGISEVHTISAIDDAPGIERYWHERFKEKCQRGEWFDLSPEDISAFKKRNVM
jgi:Meiotically up-regulated gene 113